MNDKTPPPETLKTPPKPALKFSYPPYYVGTMESDVPIVSLPGALYESLERGYAPSAAESRTTLLELRAKLRWSRPMMAAFLGVKREVLRKWENGERNPSGAARRLIWLMSVLAFDRAKLQSGLDLIFWGRSDEVKGFGTGLI